MQQGIVTFVATEHAGAWTMSPVNSGETIIPVDDAADFDPDGGMLVIDQIEDVEIAYVSVKMDEDEEDDDDDGTNTITLAEPLPFGLEDNQRLTVLPLVEETFASVSLDGEPVDVEVNHSLKMQLPEGQREPGEGEVVMIEEDDQGLYHLANIVGERPGVPASYVDNAEELLLENERMLGVVLAENGAAINQAQTDLSVAQGRINDAFSEIELKPDQAYIDTAKQQAIDAAAIEAARLADAVEDRTLSRGTDLVTNGTGYMRNNYNFSSLTFTAADAPTGISGSFLGTPGVYTQPVTDELIPVDPSKTYRVSSYARQTGVAGSGKLYMTLRMFDAAGNEIRLGQSYFINGTTTTLAEDLKPGDTTMKLTSAVGWNNTGATQLRYAIFWDYVDPFGKTWPAETYSRNGSGSDFYPVGGINTSTGVVTLTKPWSGPLKPAGTKLSNGNNSNAFTYLAWSAAVVTQKWESRSATIDGVAQPENNNSASGPGGINGTFYFYPGTAAAKVGFLLNYQPQPGSNIAVAGISLSDAAAAQQAAETAKADALAALATAEQELQEAIDSGDEAAIAEAQVKADAARDAAIDAAAIDATQKANQAKQDAIDAAALDATAKAAEAMSKATAALTAAQSAQATADNAIRTYYSATPPWADGTTQPDDVLGDMWYDDASGQAYRWNGTSWKVIQDASIGEALAAAQNAQTTADGKITAYYQPSEPMEGEEGDLWFDTNDGNRVHRRTGSTWVDLSDERIADQGEAIATLTTRTDGLAKTLWSTSLPGTTTAPKDSVWYRHDANDKITAVFTQTADPSGAQWVARPISSEAIDNLDVGKLTAASGVINDLTANAFAAKLANLIEANIGNLTVTGDTHLNSLVAEQIAGDTASFLKLTVSQILAGDIQAQWIITEDGAIVAGDPYGARVEITNDGIRVYVLGFNGEPYEAVTMVNGEISFGVMGQDGTRIAGISSAGAITGKQGSFSEDIAVKGRKLAGQLGGGAEQGWMDLLPRSIIKSNSSDYQTSYYTVEKRHSRLAAWLEPGRLYRVVGLLYGTTNNTGAVLRGNLRYIFGDGSAEPNSPEVFAPTNSPQMYSSTLSDVVRMEGFLPAVEVRTRVSAILTFRGLNGGGGAARRSFIYIEDCGPTSIEETSGDDATPRVEYVTTWAASASRSYDITGQPVPGSDGAVQLYYWNLAPYVANSAAVLFGGDSVESTADGGTSIDFGVAMHEALNGAVIHKVEVFIQNTGFWGNPEGNTTVGTLGSATLPATKLIDGSVYVPYFPEGSGVWVNLPPSWFTNGSNKGITLGDKDRVTTIPQGGTVGVSPANFQGPGDSEPPLLRVTYSR